MFIKQNLFYLIFVTLLLNICFISTLNTKIKSIDSSYNNKELLLQINQSSTSEDASSTKTSQPSMVGRKQLLKQKSSSDSNSLMNKLNKVKVDLQKSLQDKKNQNQQFNQFINDTLDKAEAELKEELSKYNDNKDVNDYYSNKQNLSKDFSDYVKASLQDSINSNDNKNQENEKALLEKLEQAKKANFVQLKNSDEKPNDNNDDSNIDKILDDYESKLEQELASLDEKNSNGLFSSLSDSFKASVESNTNAKKNIIKRILGFDVSNESPEEFQEKAKALKKKKLIAEIGLAIFLKKEEQENIIYHVNTKNKLKTKTHPLDRNYDETALKQDFIDWKNKFLNDHKDLFENEEEFDNIIRNDYNKIINKLKSLSSHGNAQMS